jgi:hypothetical protein
MGGAKVKRKKDNTVKFYKSKTNEVFVYETEAEMQTYAREPLEAITEAEALQITNPPPTEKQLAEMRVAELKQKLLDSDYIALADYDQDKPDLLAERKAWREEIRSLQLIINADTQTPPSEG